MTKVYILVSHSSACGSIGIEGVYSTLSLATIAARAHMRNRGKDEWEKFCSNNTAWAHKKNCDMLTVDAHELDYLDSQPLPGVVEVAAID